MELKCLVSLYILHIKLLSSSFLTILPTSFNQKFLIQEFFFYFLLFIITVITHSSSTTAVNPSQQHPSTSFIHQPLHFLFFIIMLITIPPSTTISLSFTSLFHNKAFPIISLSIILFIILSSPPPL